MTAILVLATGGLGSFVQMMGALNAIRIQHRGDRITLLTAPETADFAVASRLVDDVWQDAVPSIWDFTSLKQLRQRLRTANFVRVYDLDGGPRGRFFFRLMYGWGGDARHARAAWSSPGPDDAIKGRTAVHLVDRLEVQLLRAGIPEVPANDLTWVARHVTSFRIPFRMNEPFVLFACDPADNEAKSERSWPLEYWAALADTVTEVRQIPVLVGLKPAPEIREVVASRASRVIDLTGRAAITDLVFLAWAAKGAVGCDNGLMHLFAIAGCRAVVLYDGQADPARRGQRGRDVSILRRATLAEIPAGEVAATLQKRI